MNTLLDDITFAGFTFAAFLFYFWLCGGFATVSL